MLGIFDSGVGGLSVAEAIRRRAPQVDLVYFGDIAHAPYGSKNTEELQILTFRAMHFLRERGATHLVSACNSVSASVVRPLLELFGIHDSGVVEMVGPTANALRRRTNGRIVVVATPATVKSEIYQKGLLEMGLVPQMVACPELAGAIEFGASSDEIERQVANIIKQIHKIGCDTLVLGCTHYPLVRPVFEKHLELIGSSATIFDPADSVAAAALAQHGVLGSGKSRFIISKDSPVFRGCIKRYFDPETSTVEIVKPPA